MEIRSATRDDIDAVLALWIEAGADPSPTDDAEGLAGLIERDPEALLLAEADGHVLGTLIAAWDGWRGNMYRLAVHPHHRREGVAGALIADGTRRLHACGCRRITALLLADNDPARAVWEAAGFDLDGRTARYVHMPGP